MIGMSLRDKLSLSYVPRWVIVPMIRQQSVSDHSWRVTVIAVEIAHRIGQRHPPRLLGYLSDDVRRVAVTHDIHEALTGDIPSTNKAISPPPTSLPQLIVKVADTIEALTWMHMWGHPSRVHDVIADCDLKLERLLTALEDMVEGSRAIARSVEREVYSV